MRGWTAFFGRRWGGCELAQQKKRARQCDSTDEPCKVIDGTTYHHKFTTEQEKLQMKKKLKANAYYMGSILLGVGVLVCASGIEHSEGLVMFGWLAAALVLGSVALGLAAKGLVAEQQPDEGQKVHKAPTGTVTAGRRSGRKAG